MMGRTISHYRIVDKLGEGGMGVVYKAIDTRLERPVALKFLNTAALESPTHLKRFLHEARAASSLNHPNIAAVYDIETVTAESFMVMEYVAGRTLHQRIGHKGLPLDDAVRYLTPVADALSAAHAAGIVHRDLKPSNILISENGAVKLLDFGLAKLIEVSTTATVTAEAGLTSPGTIVGTFAYMSPEQARGEAVDARTDVWAFGCVLFETLTGRRAFGAPTSSESLARILDSEPDWTLLPASTPVALERLIRQCLRKDLHRRLRHIDPLLLEGLTSEAIRVAHPVRRTPLAIAGLTLVTAGALAGWLFARQTQPLSQQPLMRFTVPVNWSGQSSEFHVPRLALAPDGSSLVYVAQTASGVPQLHLRRIDRASDVTLTGTERAASPFFSPDGKAVAFFVDRQLKKISLDAGVVQNLAAGSVWGGSWVGDHIIFSGPAFTSGLIRVSSHGGVPEPLTKLGSGETSHRWPSASPDGRVVVYTASNSAGPGLEAAQIVAESLTSGRRQLLPVDATYALFAPDGQHLILVRDGVVRAAPFDADRLAVTGSSVPLMEGVLQASTGAAQLALSGSMLASVQGTSESRRLVWVDREGRAEPIDAPPRLYGHPRLSPDGRHIAVTVTESKNDIWIYDLVRATMSRLTADEWSNAYPIWTRDGRRIAYVSTRQSAANIYWRPADGTGTEERLLTSPNNQVTETWAPDGTLLFVELRPPPNGWDILTLPPDGSRSSRPFLESRFQDTTPQISPSGRYVAHGSNETGIGEIFLRSFPDPKIRLQVSDGGGGESGWRADEREVYFRRGDAMMVADVASEPELTVGRPRVLFRGWFARIQGKNYDVTPDGKRFLMVRSDDPKASNEISIVLNWRNGAGARLLPR